MADLTVEQKKILHALAESDAPCGSKDIVEATGLDKKVVSSKVVPRCTPQPVQATGSLCT